MAMKMNDMICFLKRLITTSEKEIGDGITMNEERKSVILAYRTNEDIREVCRREIEILEHWARRIINDTFIENYGQDYFSYRNENDEPLIKKEIITRIYDMKSKYPDRFPRLIDAMHLSDIIVILCKESLYNKHFCSALNGMFPQGKEEARLFLNRIETIRNKLSHANPISVREAEQVICYCHDFIDGFKMFYKEIGKEKDYNVPTFISATDVLGNSFLPVDWSESLELYIDTSLLTNGEKKEIRLRAGDIYSLSISVDPSFERDQYDIQWLVTSGFMGDNYNAIYENITKIDIPIGVNMVGSYLEIKCILTTKKEWHKHHSYDDMFELSIHTILPPIEDTY